MMETKDYLSYIVHEIHRTIVATVDDEGLPVTAAIDMMDCDDDSLYFLTAKGKGFYDRLIKRGFLAFTAMKGEDTMISDLLFSQWEDQNEADSRVISWNEFYYAGAGTDCTSSGIAKAGVALPSKRCLRRRQGSPCTVSAEADSVSLAAIRKPGGAADGRTGHGTIRIRRWDWYCIRSSEQSGHIFI